MKLRNKDKFSVEITEQILAAPDDAEDKSNFVAKDVALTQMETALQQLNAEQQQCVTLFYLHKQSYQQITEQTGLSLLQVKSSIQNGKRNLKIMIERLQQQHEH